MKEINRTAVIGAGRMGHGIAQVFAQSGCHVSLYDVDEDTLNQAPEHIKANLTLLVQRRVINEENIPTTLDRIHLETNLKTTVAKADLILEAVPERVDIKQDVFSKVEGCCEKDAILSTTTSVIRVGDIASTCKTAERLVGTHWMNPPFVLPLVEIIRGPDTNEEVIKQVRYFLEDKCGKQTVTCGDTPGFLVNRMAGAVLTEAAKLIDEGVATPKDIDRAWKEHLGFIFLQYGPFGNLDYIGLDVIVLAAKYLAWALKDDKYTLPKWLESHVLKGELGVKTGKGIYEYPGQTPEELQLGRVEQLLELLQKVGQTQGE
ncbi:MAG: 3-hydroxyacyl-CoA dehydrogenase family protein [Promethearchaeota archaeon]